MKDYRKHVFICGGPSKCGSNCGDYDVEALRSELLSLLEEMDLREWVKVSTTNCLGAKEQGPIMVIYPEGVWYKELTAEKLREIAEKHLRRGETVKSIFLYRMNPAGLQMPEGRKSEPD